ncbi:hypothetical protein AB6A40_010188 [Gnathostoma spinigerum]|uniref:Uncharacterized protein n=1 Tax=Gnathostoma spinigerum TaxID=75299 RepID=A0ABD6F116_9BILA
MSSEIKVPKTKAERIDLKRNFTDDDNTDFAYFDVPLAVPTGIFTAFHILILAIAITTAQSFAEKTSFGNGVNGWLNASKWATESCLWNVAHDEDIRKSKLPSLLLLFEFSAEGNALFRLAVCIPTIMWMFLSVANCAANDRLEFSASAFYRFINCVTPFMTFLELVCFALLSIVTIIQDFKLIHAFALYGFVFFGSLHMMMLFIVSVFRSGENAEFMDAISAAIKLVATLVFGACGFHFVLSHQIFLSNSTCHPYG